jgi:hypothetical protein
MKKGQRLEKQNRKYVILLLNFLANQFPKLVIAEVTNDLNSLLPYFYKFVTKLIS